MTQPIVYVDTSKIRPGKLAELEVCMNNLATFVEANEPQLISYAFYLDDQRDRMTVVAIHAGSSSLAHHLDVGAEKFRKFNDLIVLETIEVYGRVSALVLERLHSKARMLGSATVTVHELHAGFNRGPH